MSNKSQLHYNSYRVDKSGRITVDKNSTFSDVRKGSSGDYSYYEEEEDDSWVDIGTDYSDDDDDDHNPKEKGKPSVMLHGYTYTYEDREPRKGEKGPCCRPTKHGCHQDKKSRTVCKTKQGSTKCAD